MTGDRQPDPDPVARKSFRWRELIRLSRGYRGVLPVLVTLGALSSLADSLGISLVILFLYAAMGQPQQAAAIGGQIGSFYQGIVGSFSSPPVLAGVILATILIKICLSTSYSLLASWVQNRIGEEIRNEVHREYLYIRYDYVRGREEGEMLKVLATDSWAVSDAYLRLSRIFMGVISTAVTTLFLVTISWPIALLASAGALLIFAILNVLGGPIRKLSERAAVINQLMAAQTLHMLQGMRAIRSFGQEKRHQDEFERLARRSRQVTMRTQIAYAIVAPGSEVGFLLLLVSLLLIAEAISVPFAAALACVALLYRLQGPLRELQANVLGLAELKPQLTSVMGVLSRGGRTYPPQGELPFRGLETSIAFKNVGFQYGRGNRWALLDATFEIPAGKVTAIAGPSGAGKSTIVNLLLRLDEPGTGEILVDGVPLSRLRRENWLSEMALAGQDTELVEATVRANIALSNPDASVASLREAARLAGVLDVIEALPDKMDEWIGIQGANLSGGQRQRLGLARAIMRDPRFLILDEATSAVDLEQERAIRRNIEARYAGRTILVITHRLESVLSADHVICLEDGRVVEQGRPGEVLARGYRFFPSSGDATQQSCQVNRSHFY